MTSSWVAALIGGAMIGTAAAVVLLAHGRIAGISGIVGGLWTARDRTWRFDFLVGLLAAGAVAGLVVPRATGGPPPTLAIAGGLLVGIGTRWGSGCTSGHGVCGVGRGSRRSIIAVATFMATGVITATIGGVLS